MKNMTLAQAYKEQFGKVSYPFKIYDADGRLTYSENRGGHWEKYEYDANGNETYSEYSSGYWQKSEYDTNGKLTYSESSTGLWSKREYDAKGKEVFFENSAGAKRDKRKSSCDGKIVEIDGKKYKLKEL